MNKKILRQLAGGFLFFSDWVIVLMTGEGVKNGQLNVYCCPAKKSTALPEGECFPGKAAELIKPEPLQKMVEYPVYFLSVTSGKVTGLPAVTVTFVSVVSWYGLRPS